ncbi:hypothetical protein V493_05979 [Pseudogymnoascus sp. VKM F-4281 (FW-2241)]|nr:hypothetical protein V493_05979 [Pseudogymnoascus sp. VKM F-4281 (FW-2241)]
MADANVKIEELTFKLQDDHPVYMKKWTPATTTPLAKLVFVHGYDDHINRYYELFPTLAARGIAVTAWDQRGWGRSVQHTSSRGLTGPTLLVIADIAHVVKSELADAEAISTPLFVMGHSMGGAEVMTFASDPEYADLAPRIRGWLLESPHVELTPSSQPSALKIMAGRLAGRLLPKFQLTNKLPAEELTRDPEVVKSIGEDPLLWSTGTLEGLAGLLDRAADLAAGRRTLNPGVKSLWLAHGTVDGGTSYPASKKWFEASTSDVPDKEHKTYEGWQHQLHADLPETRPVFAKDVGDWILARVEASENNAKPQAAAEAVVQESIAVAPAAAEPTEGSAKGAAKL